MSRYHSYINSALKILQSYHGEMPFSIFIKQFFAKEKKYGSRDRKQIAAICYNWFRVGSAFNKELNEENIVKSFFLVSTETSALIETLRPEWNRMADQSFEKKAGFLHTGINPADIFPNNNLLNEQTKNDSFYISFLQQPHLFIRIRPRHKKTVVEKIKASGIDHHFLNNNNCVQLPAGSNIEGLLDTDTEIVVQDYNSQQVLDYIKEQFTASEKTTAWDCCAASGGKSILLFDLLNGRIDLTVSDIRQSILANLQQRFKKAGIKNYKHFIADISNSDTPLPGDKYDIIVCDVPCTGSGTWSRTPEQLYFFNPASIDAFAEKQVKITTNVLPCLKKNGLLFYITCSVFEKENEAIAEHICRQNGMRLLEMKNLFGYQMKADSMFVAVFKKYQ